MMDKKQIRRLQRNLSPHKPAVAAVYLWGADYAAQPGGSMDFWDSLTESKKCICRSLVARIDLAEPER